jgi:hypothetical protein
MARGSTHWIGQSGRMAGVATVLACAALACSKTGVAARPSAAAIVDDPASGPIPPAVAAAPDTSVATSLPKLPRLDNVVAQIAGDGVNLTVEPFDGARDYRVYALPSDGDVSVAPDGQVTVRNAIYRCAGTRQTPPATMDSAQQVQGGAIKTLVDGQKVRGYTRTSAEATLGYVFVAPGPGRVPVHALAESDRDSDNQCYFQRWGASRAKQYVASSDARAKLLKSRARDDGIVFYVPAAAAAGTRTVFASGDKEARFYFVEGPESSARSNARPAFEVLVRPAPDTKPLMRIFYENGCGISHDELVAGQARFERARRQGDKEPMFNLRWAGLTGPTTLVVEALDRVCPYQGTFVPAPTIKAGTDSNVKYPPLMTLEDLRKTSPSGEVYFNGQGDAKDRPRALSRSFLKVAPAKAPQMDWFQGFDPGESLAKFDEVPCGGPGGNCWQQKSYKSAQMRLDFSFVDWFSYGSLMGEFWVVFADYAADTPGKIRIMPATKGTMTPDAFLHVTMEVDSYTSGRRYPIIMISDQEAPIEWTMEKGNSLAVQTFPDWPPVFQLEVCDHRHWDVNDHCPRFDMYHLTKADDPGTVTGITAGPEIGEHLGVDRASRWDVFVSTKRAYLVFDGEPWGCADLPVAGVPKGPVTITFGDVLYHSGADVNVHAFHKEHLQLFTRRHFDNMGFKSGVPAPSWDHARFPCVSKLLK